MGSGVLLQEGEDLLYQFRPHPASYLGRYAWGLLWLAWGGLAAAATFMSPDRPPLGFFSLAALAAIHALILLAVRRPGAVPSFLWAGVALVVAVLFLVRDPPAEPIPLALLAGLAVLASLVALGRSELDRRIRRHALTTNRLHMSGGFATHRHHSIDLEKVKAVRGAQSPLGQVFGYGRLTLVLGSRRGKKGEPVEDLLEIAGVPRFDWARHQIEVAVSELRLPDRERKHRIEERRLKASMQRVASWVGREDA